MIEKVVRKTEQGAFSETQENLAFWLLRTKEESGETVEYMRRKRHGSSAPGDLCD